MNAKLVEEAPFRDQLQQDWSKWEHQRKKYLNIVTWWESSVKKKIQCIFMTEGKERARDDKMMENVYSICVYDILQELTQPREVYQITPVEGQIN